MLNSQWMNAMRTFTRCQIVGRRWRRPSKFSPDIANGNRREKWQYSKFAPPPPRRGRWPLSKLRTFSSPFVPILLQFVSESIERTVERRSGRLVTYEWVTIDTISEFKYHGFEPVPCRFVSTIAPQIPKCYYLLAL